MNDVMETLLGFQAQVMQLLQQGQEQAALDTVSEMARFCLDEGQGDLILDEGLRREIFFGLSMRVWVARDKPRISPGRVLRLVDELDEFLEVFGNVAWKPVVMSCRAQLMCDLGQIDEAIELSRAAVEWCRAHEPDEDIDELRLVLLLVKHLMFAGRKEEAQTLVAAYEDRPGREEILGNLRMLVGQDITAAEKVRYLEEMATGDDDLYSRCLSYTSLALEKLKIGDVDGARAAATLGLELAQEEGSPKAHAWAYLSLARVVIRAGSLEEAIRPLVEAHRFIGRITNAADKAVLQRELSALEGAI